MHLMVSEIWKPQIVIFPSSIGSLTVLISSQYILDENGKRIYTLKKVLNGQVTKSAHPARFSPDDKYSRYGPPSNKVEDRTRCR